MTSQLREIRQRKNLTNPILFFCKYLCFHFILASHAACPRLYCTVHIAVGHSWLAKLLTLVICLKTCVKNQHWSSGVEWWWQTISYYLHSAPRQPGQSVLDQLAREKRRCILRGIAGLNFWQSIKRSEKFVFSTLVRHYKPNQLQDRHVFIRLYKQYVRPHLVFSTQAWAPWTKAEKSYLEKTNQKRAVKMVFGLARWKPAVLSGVQWTSSRHIYDTVLTWCWPVVVYRIRDKPHGANTQQRCLVLSPWDKPTKKGLVSWA